MATRKKTERDESNYVKYLCYRSSGFKLGDADKEIVWVPTDDERSYAQAEVIKKDDQKFTAKLENNTTKEFPNNEKGYLGVNPPKFDGVEDMAELGHLNEPAVLYNLTKRYDVDLFHTYSGLFLVIINPYKRLPIYTDEIISVYTGRRRDQVAPHVFALADTAYREMLQDRKDQSMLITGESGAGKTENTKKVIQYLATIAGRAAEGGTLEQQLLEFNPILEAFGNAKTTKNNNSSRFGKFIELQFNAGGQIAGANTYIYLLEKSRVVYQAKNERNFHVFYQLIAGATAEEKTKLHLSRCEDFNFLNQSGCTTVKFLDDSKEFEHSVRAFDVLNVSEDERWGIWEVVSAILHLGNLPFSEDNKETATLKNDTALKIAAELLGVDANPLREGLLRPKMEVGGRETVTKAMNLQKVIASRDALVKALYGRLFIWIVNKINQALSHPEKKTLFIGVLDISGFEIFTHNSFEQLCINYTNEKLQQFFNHHMFTLEQKEYESEGIEWNFIDFGMDSQDTIDLIEKPPNGILTILDEQTNFPDATDTTFCRRLHRTNGAHRSFRKPRFEADTFKIIHYAGEVEYETQNWLEKNRDPLEDDLEKCLKTSKSQLIQELFREGLMPNLVKKPAAEPTGKVHAAAQGLSGQAHKSKIWTTVAFQYKEQLEHLMSTLRQTTPHFIRCIIPNLEQRPGLINSKIVLDQLKCNGVLEGIRITRKGFPNRILYPAFLKRYHLLKPGHPNNSPQPKAAVKELVDYMISKNPTEVKEDQVRYGHTKIFFRTGQLPAIERLRERLLSSMIISIQAGTRAFLARRLYEKLREQTTAAKVLQRNLRAWMELKDSPWFRLFVTARPLITQIDWQAEITALQAKVADLERELKLAIVDKESLEKSKRALEEQLAKLQRENADNFEQVQTLKDTKEELEAEKKLLTKKVEGLQEELDDEMAMTKDLEGEKKRLEGSILDLQNKLDDADNAQKDLQNQKSKVAAERDEWKDRCEDSEAASATLKKQLEDTESKLIAAEDQKYTSADIADTLKTKLRNIEETANKLQSDLAEEQKKANTLESTKKKLTSDVDRLTNQITDLNTERESTTAQIRKITAELTAAQSDLASEKTKASKLDKQYVSLKNRLKEIEQIAEGAEEVKTNASRSKKIMEEKIEELNESIKDLDAEKKALNNRLTAARTDADEVNRLLEEAEAQSKRWETEAKQRAQDITEMEADLENEREQGRKQRQQMNSKIQELTLRVELGGPSIGGVGDLKSLQAELELVRKELTDARDSKIAAEKGLTSITIERDDYKTQFEKVEQLCAKYLKENRRLTSELDEAVDKGTTAQAARELLQNTNQEYVLQITSLRKQVADAAVGGRSGLEANQLLRENTQLKEDNKQLDRKMRVTEIELREVKPQIDDLRYQLEQEKASNVRLNLTLKDKEKVLLERELANARLIQSLSDSSATEKAQVVNEVAELRRQNEELTLKYNKVNEDFESLYQRMLARGGGATSSRPVGTPPAGRDQ